jgi:hypothetical protein
VNGYHGSTGVRPDCDAVLKRHGFDLPASMFMKVSR